MLILSTFLISVGINAVMFVPAYFLKTDKLTDISYAVTFVVLSSIVFFTSGVTLPSIVLLAAIIIWAARLGIYLLTRIRRIGKDSRFDEMRNSFWRFGRFWLLQGFTVWIVLLPSIMFFSNSPNDINGHAYIGLVIWALGLLIETAADRQKYNFINNPANNGKWIDTGLWKYSRHPNYFGEIMLWIGLYLYALGGLSLNEAFIGAIGPVYIALLIIFVSGIPLLEKSANKRWGDNARYQNYLRRTSVLIPWFNKKV